MTRPAPLFRIGDAVRHCQSPDPGLGKFNGDLTIIEAQWAVDCWAYVVSPDGSKDCVRTMTLVESAILPAWMYDKAREPVRPC